MLFGITLALASFAASAGSPPTASVTIANTPLPVSVTGTPTVTVGNTVLVGAPTGAALPVILAGDVQTIKEAQNFTGGFGGTPPPGSVPSMLSPVIFRNDSTTTALVYAYVSHPIQIAYVCNGGVRPTAIDVNIWPIGTLYGRTIQLPMQEHLAVRRAGVDYCWAEMSNGPFFIPPAFEMRFNIVYSDVPPSPMTVQINVNGYYMK
jgi:hypothetical protein